MWWCLHSWCPAKAHTTRGVYSCPKVMIYLQKWTIMFSSTRKTKPHDQDSRIGSLSMFVLGIWFLSRNWRCICIYSVMVGQENRLRIWSACRIPWERLHGGEEGERFTLVLQISWFFSPVSSAPEPFAQSLEISNFFTSFTKLNCPFNQTQQNRRISIIMAC